MDDQKKPPMSRRDLFGMIGTMAGSAVMLQAMNSLAYGAEAGYSGPPKLSGDVKGATVLILGAGLAGMVSAYDLRKAGYTVQILEYQNRSGGRNWSLYGGDKYTELGGFTQNVQFDKGLYLNPGPWRIPYHHQGILHYCKLLGVQLEPFMQANYNAYIHSTKAFGGKPQRFRHIQADFQGYAAELLAKSTRQNALDGAVTKEDQEILLGALRNWGALDSSYQYKGNEASNNKRGFEIDPGGGLSAQETISQPIELQQLLTNYEDALPQGFEPGQEEPLLRLNHAIDQLQKRLFSLEQLAQIDAEYRDLLRERIEEEEQLYRLRSDQQRRLENPLEILRAVELNHRQLSRKWAPGPRFG